jgi:hypothetical protein
MHDDDLSGLLSDHRGHELTLRRIAELAVRERCHA